MTFLKNPSDIQNMFSQSGSLTREKCRGSRVKTAHAVFFCLIFTFGYANLANASRGLLDDEPWGAEDAVS